MAESEVFQRALSLSDYHKKQAIKLYDEEIENNPKNMAAFQNRGLCKLKIAIEEKNIEILEDSKVDLKKAIDLAKERGDNFPIAQANLKWAEETKIE